MRLYSNLLGGIICLQRARLDATSEERSAERSALRLRMKRLDALTLSDRMDDYRGGAMIKYLA